MAFTKEQKQKIIEDLKEKITLQKAMIFINFAGLQVKDILELKEKLRAIDSVFKVCKKTLLGLVLKEKKLAVDTETLEGQLAVVFAFDKEMPALKTVYEFSKTNENLEILGGFLENQFQEKEYLIELAQLPSKEELLARLVGSIRAPLSNFANVLQANIKGLIFALCAIKENK